jgi:hypothetical protein
MDADNDSAVFAVAERLEAIEKQLEEAAVQLSQATERGSDIARAVSRFVAIHEADTIKRHSEELRTSDGSCWRARRGPTFQMTIPEFFVADALDLLRAHQDYDGSEEDGSWVSKLNDALDEAGLPPDFELLRLNGHRRVSAAMAVASRFAALCCNWEDKKDRETKLRALHRAAASLNRRGRAPGSPGPCDRLDDMPAHPQDPYFFGRDLSDLLDGAACNAKWRFVSGQPFLEQMVAYTRHRADGKPAMPIPHLEKYRFGQATEEFYECKRCGQVFDRDDPDGEDAAAARKKRRKTDDSANGIIIPCPTLGCGTPFWVEVRDDANKEKEKEGVSVSS